MSKFSLSLLIVSFDRPCSRSRSLTCRRCSYYYLHKKCAKFLDLSLRNALSPVRKNERVWRNERSKILLHTPDLHSIVEEGCQCKESAVHPRAFSTHFTLIALMITIFDKMFKVLATLLYNHLLSLPHTSFHRFVYFAPCRRNQSIEYKSIVRI